MIKNRISQANIVKELLRTAKGGPGSGNFGHGGRPGEIGGSGGGGGGGDVSGGGGGGGSGNFTEQDISQFHSAWEHRLNNATDYADIAPYGDMDLEETMAVRLYSTHESNALNSSLRKGTSTADDRLLAEYIDSGLDKLPKYKGETYRGMNVPSSFDGNAKDYAKSFKVGSTLSDPSFTSSSSNIHISDDFISKPNGGVTFKINSHSGREISGLSHVPTENEIVFRRGTNFKVTRVTATPNSKWSPYTVHLDEVKTKAVSTMLDYYLEGLTESDPLFRESIKKKQ